MREPQHLRLLPPEQTGGGAETSKSMLQFFRVNEPVVRKRHHALPTKKTATAFWAIPRCWEVLGENEVFGLQRVKHHGLREIFA